MSVSRSQQLLRGVAAALAVATLALPNPVFAGGLRSVAVAPRPETARTLAGAVTLDAAISQAERRYNARVVKAETKQEDGRTVFELRLLSEDGRVWTIRVDGATGAVL